MKSLATSKNRFISKIVLAIFFIFLIQNSFAQNSNNNSRDLSYLTSGGKLHPLQAIMDIRHYTIALDIDIANRSFKGSTEVNLNLSEKN